LITALHIVLGELAPKGVALQRTESTALFVARPMLVFHAVFRWPIAVLNAAGNGVLRLVGLHGTPSHDAVHSVDELRLLVARMQEAGVVDISEARIASRAVQFGDVPSGALMTPRTEIEAVPLSSTLPDLVQTANASHHNRWPVYDRSLDDVIGVLHLRSVLRATTQASAGFDLRANLRPILVAPASKPARDLLDDMRRSGQHAAVLLDEYGGTAGMVTLQDLLGALVGRIDAESETGGALRVEHAPAGSLVLDGLTRLSELEDVAGVHLEADAYDVETLGGLVMYCLGAIPSVGDEIQLDDWLIRVLELDGRRVARLQLQREARS
jgi:CBS domain containing-hemolysin-like protein